VATISASDVKALREQTGAGMMDCKRALTDAEGDVTRATELLRERGLSKAGKRAGRDTTEGAVAFSIEGGNAALVELGCETDFVAKTDAFQKLASDVAAAVIAGGGTHDTEAALAMKLGGATVDETIKAAVAQFGENVQLKRVASIEVKGLVGGYIHGAGKLGVLVALEGEVGDAVENLARDLAMHVAAHDPTPVAIDRSGVDASTIEAERRVLTNEAKASGKPDAVVEKMVDGRINKFYKEHCLLEQGFVKDPDQSVAKVVEAAAKEAGGTIKVVSFERFRLGEGASE